MRSEIKVARCARPAARATGLSMECGFGVFPDRYGTRNPSCSVLPDCSARPSRFFLTEPRRSPAAAGLPRPEAGSGAPEGLELSPCSVFRHESGRYPYLAQVTDRTAVSRLLGISWVTVGSIVERVVARRLDGARFAKLRRIGVDEFSYRKRHRYLTIVVDHDERRVVWAGRGRSAETLGAFFEQLGPGGCARIELVTADLASSWQKALRAWVPHARVVFDRFHVERLAADAVDEVRRSEQRRLASEPEDAKALKGTRYALLKHPARLRPGEARRLETLRRKNRALNRAYELKEYLATILGQATPDDAPALLDEWLEWAARSRLTPFVKLGRTIRKHAEGILAYLDTKMTNGPVEGINNKLRVIARRAYGFHSPGALISMLFLCCGGIELAPPLPTRI